MKDGKYSVMIVEDQQMPKALFSHFVESSDKFYLQVAIENASVADIVCTRTPVDLILDGRGYGKRRKRARSGGKNQGEVSQNENYHSYEYAGVFLYKARKTNRRGRLLV